jgi:hypothetical protein
MYNGRRPTSALEPRPGLSDNQLKPARGYYRLSVHHKTFVDGVIKDGEVREGCVSYGQWRQFSVVTSGPATASLYVSAVAVNDAGLPLATGRPTPLSALYARRNKAPTEEVYDAVVYAPDSTLSTSPCYVDEPYEYHLATYLTDQLRASAIGLSPTLFTLTPQLLSADGPSYGTVDWPADGSTMMLTAPLALGGGGHVCCQQFRYWVLRNVPPDVEPVLSINVSMLHLGTPNPPPSPKPPPPFAPPPPPSNPLGNGTMPSPPPPLLPPPMQPPPPPPDKTLMLRGDLPTGNVQSLFAKRLTCPTPKDVLADRSGCTGRCAVSWLSHYETYSGRSTFLDSTSVSAGFAAVGAESAPSDWYVGVQALKEEQAEFFLYVSSRKRPREAKAYECSRLNHFCPGAAAEMHNSTVDGEKNPADLNSMLPLESAAVARRWNPRLLQRMGGVGSLAVQYGPAGGVGGLLWALPALCAALLMRGRGAGRPRAGTTVGGGTSSGREASELQ